MAPISLYRAVVLGHPRTVGALLLLLFGLAAWWIPSFQLDASADSLVLEHDEDLLYARRMTERYGSDEFVFVTFTPQGDLLAQESLDELRRLRDELDSLERVDSVTSLLDVPLLRNPPVPLSEVTGNLKELDDPDIDIELAREELATSPLYSELIVSEDLRTTAMQVTFATDAEHAKLAGRRRGLIAKRVEEGLSAKETAELEQLEPRYLASKDRQRDLLHEDITAIRGILERHRAESDATLYLGGVPMIADDIVTFIRTDLTVFGLGMVLLLIATLGVLFRRPLWVVLPMVCCACSAITMIGLLGFIGWEVTVVSSNFISLQLIFTMSLTIHLIVRYREVLRLRPDDDQVALVEDTVRHTFVPCLYASLTTIAGFSSLILCDILPVMNFGWMMTMGVSVSLAVVFLLFPAALMLVAKPAAEGEKDFGLWFTRGLGKFTEHRGTAVLGLSGLVALLTFTGASQLRVENSFIDYFRESTEIYQGMEFIDRELGGTTPLDVTLEFASDEPEPVELSADESVDEDFAEFDDEFSEFDDFDEFGDAAADREDERAKYWFTTTKLGRVERVHDYLDALSATGKVSSLATLSKLGRDINGGEPLDDFLLAILFQKMPEDFKEQLIEPFVSIEDDQARINVRIVDSMEGLRRDALLTQIREDLRDELGLQEDEYRLTGLMVLYNNMLQSLFDSQIKTIGYTVLALMVMFVILFRSLRIALIAIFPSLLSSLTVLGVMGLGGIPLDVMTITIVAISVGIAVDDTIHYLHRFKREFAEDANYVRTMHRCHGSIGSAMYYTTITITIGFSILAISNFIPSMVFGLMTALAMMMALVSALSLLPKLIVTFRPFGPETA